MMAAAKEIQSLDDINYKSHIRGYLWPGISLILFLIGFLSFYPVGEKLKSFIEYQTRSFGCDLEFQKAEFEFFIPKLVFSNITIPSQCLGGTGPSISLEKISINYHLLSFSPFGLPFKVTTLLNKQPIEVYFVQGFSKRLLRLKDQKLDLQKISVLFNEKMKINGTLTTDLKALITHSNQLESLSLKAQSKNLSLPPQNIEGLTTPFMKINDFYIEIISDNSSTININKFILGDPDSPVRGNFKGGMGLKQNNIPLTQLNLVGELALSDSFKKNLPILDMLLGQFTQKDGFYQIQIGGSLGSPKFSSP